MHARHVRTPEEGCTQGIGTVRAKPCRTRLASDLEFPRISPPNCVETDFFQRGRCTEVSLDKASAIQEEQTLMLLPSRMPRFFGHVLVYAFIPDQLYVRTFFADKVSGLIEVQP